MIGDYGEVLVMDWGLAKEGSGSEPSLNGSTKHEHCNRTIAGQVLGSPNYMSPEQARGEIDCLDQRTDIYALGALLFHMVALAPPVQGRNSKEVIQKAARGEITPPAARPCECNTPPLRARQGPR